MQYIVVYFYFFFELFLQVCLTPLQNEVFGNDC